MVAAAAAAGELRTLIEAVELGRVPASAALATAAAKALSITVHDFCEQPTPRFGAERAGVSELETAVMAGAALAGDTTGTTLANLEERVRQIATLLRRSRYDASSAEIPDLLADRHTAASSVTGDRDTELVHHMLATVYGAPVIFLHRLGSALTGQAAKCASRSAQLLCHTVPFHSSTEAQW